MVHCHCPFTTVELATEFTVKYRRLKRLYANRPKGGRRISVDEFGPLNLLPRHGKHYAKIGHMSGLLVNACSEEPDALIALVRVCGGAPRVTGGSTWKMTRKKLF